MAEAAARLGSIKACVFDAYGTLFDISAVTTGCRDALGDKTEALARLWRQKQLEYTWLRSLIGVHADFWQITGESLDYALGSLGLADPPLRARLMQRHLIPPPFPDARRTLETLHERGLRTAILSNGSPTMLTAAVNNADLRKVIDLTISVEAVHVYKPHPTVYALAPVQLGIESHHICFVSANPWDVAGGAHFGFQTAWINRAEAIPERLPWRAAVVIRSLAELPDLIGG